MTAAEGTERSEQIAEYAELAKAKRQSRQDDEIESKRADGRGHRQECGRSAASRDLGLSEPAVRRAEAIASIAPEAKAAAECAVIAEIAAPEAREMAAVKAWIAGGCEGPKLGAETQRAQTKIAASRERGAAS